VEDAQDYERDSAPNEEFRRRVKTQGALPTEDAALVLLFSPEIASSYRPEPELS
jgi:hypothetical protein